MVRSPEDYCRVVGVNLCQEARRSALEAEESALEAKRNGYQYPEAKQKTKASPNKKGQTYSHFTPFRLQAPGWCLPQPSGILSLYVVTYISIIERHAQDFTNLQGCSSSSQIDTSQLTINHKHKQ